MDCGGRYPGCAMDLDHVRGDKKFSVSEAVQHAYALTMEALREEIAKCEVVCANCHRVRTEARGYAMPPHRSPRECPSATAPRTGMPSPAQTGPATGSSSSPG